MSSSTCLLPGASPSTSSSTVGHRVDLSADNNSKPHSFSSPSISRAPLVEAEDILLSPDRESAGAEGFFTYRRSIKIPSCDATMAATSSKSTENPGSSSSSSQKYAKSTMSEPGGEPSDMN